MTKVKLMDIELAFDFVNFGGLSDNSAVINRETGEIHYLGDGVEEELPEDFDEEDDSLVWVPDKRDLDVGTKLVMEFARKHCSEDLDDIHFMFSHRGAYAHFKRFLEKKNLLEKWYKFEEEKNRDALLEWCQINKIDVDDTK
jgi:hypothetical protein